MQLSTPEIIISKSQRETIMSNIAFSLLIWNSFLKETEKNTLSEHFFKCKIKKKDI